MSRRRTQRTRDGKKQKPGKVVMYTLPGCGHCQRARTLFASRSIDYDEIQGAPTVKFRQQLASLAGSGTAPQIVIRGHAIGGASDLARLDRIGVLGPLAEGKTFPHAFPQKRLSMSGLLRSGFGLFSREGREPQRHQVALLDEKGAVVDTHIVASEEAAAELAAELNAAPA
jgi:glutaredoxin